MRTKLTQQNLDYIKANRLHESGKSMAKRFGVGDGVVARYMRKNGLQVSKELQNAFRGQGNVGKTSSTPQIDEILKSEYLKIPEKTLTKKIGRSHCFVKTRLRQLSLHVPKELIEQRKKDSQIKKGNVPPNKGKKISEYMSPETIEIIRKTQFKKGFVPHNTKEKDGVITIHNSRTNRTSKPYKFIRLGLAKWLPYHQFMYEQKYGKLPKEMCLRFKDGDTLNCKLENLEVITRAENMRLNSIHRYPDEIKTSIRLLSKLNKKLQNAK